jgi:hypothetical protein
VAGNRPLPPGLQTSAPASWSAPPPGLEPAGPAAAPGPPTPPTADHNRTLLIGFGLLAVAALIVVVLAAIVVPALRGDDNPATPDVVGRCIAYTAGEPRRVARVVTCDGPHDGVVLARAATAGACPVETDAVLIAESDPAGRGAVLCIGE